ncbi:MAG: putative bacteriophage protein, partial [Thermoleophilia bacterium]|nr:putative bacteriophage protein [Thermoleophilia bacterium]
MGARQHRRVRSVRSWCCACLVVLAAATAAPAQGEDTAPLAGELQVSHVAISPDGDGRADDAELAFRVARTSWVRAAIVDDAGVARRVLWSSQVDPGQITLTWDGLDDSGTRLRDARYRVRVEAWPAPTEGAPLTAAPTTSPAVAIERNVDVDTRAPALDVAKALRHRAGLRLLDVPLGVSEESLVEVHVYEGKARRLEPLALALPAGRAHATVRTSDKLFRTRAAGSYRIELVASDAAWNTTRRWITVRTTRDRVFVPPTRWDAGSDGVSLPTWLRPIMLRATVKAGVPAEWASSPALAQLLLHESTFNPRAQNPTSTAYGLFQFLDSTWAGSSGRKTSDPYLQSVYGLRYIKHRYRTPERAWAFWQRQWPHWYAVTDGGREVALGTLATRRIEELQLSHASVSPNGDGHADAVDVTPRMRLASTAAVTVRTGAGVVVCSLWSSDLPAGDTTLAWDGLDDSGHHVPDGTYTVSVRAFAADTPGDVDEATATVAVDTTTARPVAAGVRVRARGAALLRVPVQLAEEAQVTVGVRDGARTRELTFLQPAGPSYIELRAPRAWEVARRAGHGTVSVRATDAAWNEAAAVVPVDIVPAPVSSPSSPVAWGGGALLMPVHGTITSPFGSRWGRMHEGLDIAAPSGTAIL